MPIIGNNYGRRHNHISIFGIFKCISFYKKKLILYKIFIKFKLWKIDCKARYNFGNRVKNPHFKIQIKNKY